MAREAPRPAYHPAGHDTGLRDALQELRAGHWLAMRMLLHDTPDWPLWTQRTQVLATAAAGTDVVQMWLYEEPRSVAAVVMHARVVVERALRAHREHHRRTDELCREALDACHVAAHASPRDPVPWVCLLALAQLDEKQEWDDHHMAPPEPMLPTGPWGLLAEAHERDPYNREAYHRMLQCMYLRRPGDRMPEAVNYAQWAVSSAPAGSALHVLPLYVRVERYRRSGGLDAALDLHWVAEDATREAEHALRDWFESAPAIHRSLLDLNHLAHALWGALRFHDAARVFEALGPFYTPLPWSHRTRAPGDPGLALEVFLQARNRCLSATGDPGPST
jgi:hypothetical protein